MERDKASPNDFTNHHGSIGAIMETNDNKTVKKVLSIVVTVLLCLLVVYGTITASMTAYDFGYRVFTEPAMEEQPGSYVQVTIDESMGASEIADVLCEKGLVRDANLFWLQYKLSAYSGEIVPGTYTLNTSMTAKEMMIIMAAVETDTETEE